MRSVSAAWGSASRNSGIRSAIESSRSRVPSSWRESSAAATIIFVVEPIPNSVSACTGSSASARLLPTPAENATRPSITTATAAPGTPWRARSAEV